MKESSMDLKLPKDLEHRMVGSLQRYLSEAFGTEVGELKAGLCLAFFLEEIAPSIYNRAIADAQGVMQERVADLENVCFAQEFAYWTKGAKKGVARKPEFRR